MANELTTFQHWLRHLTRPSADDQADTALLERFAADRNEAASGPEGPERSPRVSGEMQHTRQHTTMFTLWGAKQRFCDAFNCCSFLKIGPFGASLTLADMLRLRVNGVLDTF